ncbi:hypothetical protein DQ04_00201270 [Trypanosoma grayi]|uniref:hypothetical protein n=1 Tax=Trypanosoma grayi TaxID=71804 RepID=UPI0004F478FE|nr:hypothetical protein DQ04_00201270 [Trypanosoma grayi]KEG15074.1 hypothetical protein DQ04_00201270 [Trypanosoma grayi]
MSSIAKKMLERHGWKEGMGLGRDAQGVKTYVKVVRRDPHTATGLGHAADATQAPQASTFAVELDAVYSTLSATKRGRKKVAVSDSDAEEEEAGTRTAGKGDAERRKRQRSPSSSSSSSSEKSNSDSEEDSDAHVDITRLKDDELLRRCGGVRLGRAGRHRFFEGKLRRIEESHRES